MDSQPTTYLPATYLAPRDHPKCHLLPGNDPYRGWYHFEDHPDTAIQGTAKLGPKAQVLDFGRLCGSACLLDDSVIVEHGVVNERATVEGRSTITGHASVTGSARVTDRSILNSQAYADGQACIKGGYLIGPAIWCPMPLGVGAACLVRPGVIRWGGIQGTYADWLAGYPELTNTPQPLITHLVLFIQAQEALGTTWAKE